MEGTIYLISGTIVLLLVFYDFFYTTLSASGAAFITKGTSVFLHHLLKLSAKVFGRKAFSISGVWVNLPMLFLWLLLFWVGLFLVFSYNPEGVVSSSGKVASDVERFYFTGYVISTLGLGNFKPITPLFEILTSSFSLLGFIIITTSMTYFISVSSAVIEKRNISLLIRNLGKSPQEVIQNLLNMKESLRVQQFTTLQQMIDRHSNNHQSYPVIHFYNTPKKDSSLSINLAVMDEALSILLHSDKLKDIHTEVQPLRKAITNFFDHVQEKYKVKAKSAPTLRWQELDLPEHVLENGSSDQSELDSRRKVLTGLLKGENWSWKEFIRSQPLKKKNSKRLITVIFVP